MNEILFCEIDQPIIQQRIIRQRHDGLELFFIALILLLAVLGIIYQNGATLRLLPIVVLTIFFIILPLYIGIVKYFNNCFNFYRNTDLSSILEYVDPINLS